MNAYRRKQAIFAAPVISLFLLLVGCGSDQRESNVSQGEIAAKAQAWQNRRIDDYTLVYREICFCEGGEVTVVVRDNKIDKASRSSSQGRGERPVANPLSVDGLFDLISRAEREADELTVRFNDDLDYPDSITIDWLQGATDDEYGIDVVRLTQQ